MNLPKPTNYQKLFLDMDSFFASVEQQVQPPLRDVPEFVNFSPISDSRNLIRHALNLFEKIDFSQSAPINIFLVAFKLAQANCQRSLFAEIQKTNDLSHAIDEINDEFGPDSIYFAETDHDSSIAPNRIPFGRPRYEMS